MEAAEEKPDVRPHASDPGDRCGRCGTSEFAIGARRYHSSGWVINLCDRCLRPAEETALHRAVEEALYLSGLR